MKLKNIGLVFIAGLFLVLLTFTACSGSTSSTTTTPTTTGGGGALVNSDSIITGEIQTIHSQSTGYPWQISVRIASTQNVDDLPNPMADKVGQVVALQTDQDLSAFSMGQSITARVKYVGDVPKPGITLYIYEIKAQ
jgi:hypothetical protein